MRVLAIGATALNVVHNHPTGSPEPSPADVRLPTGLPRLAAIGDAKTVALEFLLHFVGDVHQPLHAADNHDEGGNAVAITYSYSARGRLRTKTTNLHAYWDTVTVDRFGTSPDSIAAELIRTMPRRFAGKWRKTDPASWAQESFNVARKTVYKLPAMTSGQPIALTAAYLTASTSAARLQLQVAGYRLAMLLNATLR